MLLWTGCAQWKANTKANEKKGIFIICMNLMRRTGDSFQIIIKCVRLCFLRKILIAFHCDGELAVSFFFREKFIVLWLDKAEYCISPFDNVFCSRCHHFDSWLYWRDRSLFHSLYYTYTLNRMVFFIVFLFLQSWNCSIGICKGDMIHTPDDVVLSLLIWNIASHSWWFQR